MIIKRFMIKTSACIRANLPSSTGANRPIPSGWTTRDIYVSFNLGTNVVHYQAHRILAEMAKLKGEESEIWEQRAEGIKKGINTHLWMHDKGYYAQYLYGRSELIQSPRYEALGEALAIMFGVADEAQAASIMAKSPLTEYGATCIYPQIPGIPPYHNNGIWPFVQSYWNWAAARSGNEAVLNHGLASVYRAAGLFLTNYENMVAETGDFLGTEINSHRMLWSMAGNLAMVHRVFMGMQFEADGLRFAPTIPEAYGGSRTLSNFSYRNAKLNITVNGHGTNIKSFSMDGKKLEEAFVPANLEGEHAILIEMENNAFPHQDINMVENHFTLPTILAEKDGEGIRWQPVEGAVEYRIYNQYFKPGVISTTNTRLEASERPYADRDFSSYLITAVMPKAMKVLPASPSYLQKTHKSLKWEDVAAKSNLPYSNYSGNGFVEISLDKNREISFSATVEEAGEYLLDFRYANGSGPWNTDNKCAIRSLTVNGDYEGVIVLPQRGKDEWSDWGFSNLRRVSLKAGSNTVKVHFEDWNNNMNVDVNTAMLDYMRLRRL